MNGYYANIEEITLANETFRTVLYTANNTQLVVMSLKPGEEIGEEVHGVDQFIRIEAGTGKTVLNGEERKLNDGSAVLVPAGTKHNIINTSATAPMKLYTVYGPPNHIDGTVHKTKAAAEKDEDRDHFDGKTTESQ
ncbi:MAG: uncharacterized protein JWM46_882 [Candidatus Kaiserbacteria bacterium]|nr:uncharacterized protein [Candidatus Kaiserbacteria bacterium]